MAFIQSLFITLFFFLLGLLFLVGIDIMFYADIENITIIQATSDYFYTTIKKF